MDEWYQCDQCSKLFSNRRGIAIHIAKMHKNGGAMANTLNIVELGHEYNKLLKEIRDLQDKTTW